MLLCHRTVGKVEKEAIRARGDRECGVKGSIEWGHLMGFFSPTSSILMI